MSEYDDLLGATIDFLEAEKSRGQRFVAVDWEKVEALKRPIEPPAEMTLADVAWARAHLIPDDPEYTESNPAPTPEVAEKEISKSPSTMAELRVRTLVCEQCPKLVTARKQVVFGVGNEAADLMFVGEAPGADEDAQGEPFVGEAGQLLTKIIQTMGLSRDTVYIANILKCRPDTPGKSSGNRTPTREEMDTCSPWLHRQIEIIQPKVIVALGKTAVGGLLEMENVPITKFRGTWSEYRGIPLMPTYHPAYLLHQQSLANKRALWEDMLATMEKLGLPISEKQRGFFLPRNQP